ncbi:MAG: hypothetical protein C0501_30860 [Isosphaera sp.]|nr:hypothetical protein [Isosphaera sp.]
MLGRRAGARHGPRPGDGRGRAGDRGGGAVRQPRDRGGGGGPARGRRDVRRPDVPGRAAGRDVPGGGGAGRGADPGAGG